MSRRPKHDAAEAKRRLISYCRQHPYATKTAIIKDLNLKSRTTLDNDLQVLYKEGALARRWVFDPAKHGWKHRYRVDVRINPRDLKASPQTKPDDDSNPQEMLAHQIMDLYGYKEDAKGLPPSIFVQDIQILLGDIADLSVVVWCNDPDQLYEFITKRLRCMHGIENTNTCTEAWSAVADREQKKLATNSLNESR